MHGAAQAFIVSGAITAQAGFCPGTVPHYLKTVVPHIKKVVLVDAALYKMPVYIGAGRWGMPF
jgi:hypothetical protein